MCHLSFIIYSLKLKLNAGGTNYSEVGVKQCLAWLLPCFALLCFALLLLCFVFLLLCASLFLFGFTFWEVKWVIGKTNGRGLFWGVNENFKKYFWNTSALGGKWEFEKIYLQYVFFGGAKPEI